MSSKIFRLLCCVVVVRSIPLRLRDGPSLVEGRINVTESSSPSLADVQPRGILWAENTGEFIVGLIMMIVSVSASWFFERQLARLECLVSIGRSSCVRVPDAEVLPENFGQLVHLSGQSLRPEAPIQDPRFACHKLGNACTRLRTQVQAYQCVEGASKWSEEISGRSGSVPAMPVGVTISNSSFVQEARKSRMNLALEDQICPQSRLCCSCNFVAGCCTGVATPEIFRLFEGNRSFEACFADLRKTCNLDVGFGTWTFRFLALTLLVVGIYMSFSEAFLHVYPVMNSVKVSSARISASLCVATAITSTVIGVAFFPHKIGKSCIYLTLAIFLLLLPLVLMC